MSRRDDNKHWASYSTSVDTQQSGIMAKLFTLNLFALGFILLVGFGKSDLK